MSLNAVVTIKSSVNWLLIVLCVVVVIVASFFLFYWNRVLGWILGFIARRLYWKKNNVWIEFDAVQFSLLAGRVFVKEFRYHSTNQSIRIVKCHITWRYWFWRTRGETEMGRTHFMGEDVNHKFKELPCRFKVAAEGVEWFIYNRTPAYDDIIKQMMPGLDEMSPSSPVKNKGLASVDTPDNKGTSPSPNEHPPLPTVSRSVLQVVSRCFAIVNVVGVWLAAQIPSFEWGDLLPIGIAIIRGAIVVGNDSTPTILIGDFKLATGTVGTSSSRSVYDLHKQLYAFKFEDAKIYTKINRDYESSMLDRGRDLLSELHRKGTTTVPSPSTFSFRTFHDLAPRWFGTLRKRGAAPVHSRWQGLSRYYTQIDVNEREHSHEYARLSTLLETPVLEVNYYSDVAGLVPENPRSIGMAGLETMDVGNGDLAPQWGVDIVIHGGQVNYGPWADRQRRALQETFFPSTFQTRHPTTVRRPGETRIHVALKIFVELREEITLRIPIRESSKNWRYDAIDDLGPIKRTTRPFGWLDVRIGPNSSVNYVMSMVAHEQGYDNILQVHIDQLSVLSSVNQARFLAAESCRVLCEMPSPLQWNADRQWMFDVSMSRPIIHLLRDHVTLITDLSKDWSTGPPADFNRFVPITYILRVAFKDIHLHLYVNDHNVIDFPLVDQQNSLLTISGPSLHAEVSFPSTKYRPMSTSIPFTIEAPGLDVSLTHPSWNTHSVFGTPRTQSLGHIGLIRVDSSLTYFADVRSDCVDVFKCEIKARSVVFKAMGRAIRHFMIVRDNYFGGFTNFSTRAEYFAKKEINEVGDPIKLKYRPGKSNMFQVSLLLNVQDIIVLLPQEFNDCRAAVRVGLPELQLALSLHDYYMEMTLNTHPLQLSAIDDCSTMHSFDSVPQPQGASISLNGVDINGNRLFGPPPQNATYLCLWEIELGALQGNISPVLLAALMSASTAFGINFSDPLNSPSEDFTLRFDPDVTFLKIRLKSLDIAWRMDGAAVRLALPNGVSYDANDLSGKEFRHVKSLVIPLAKAQCLLAQSNVSQTPLSQEWLEVAAATFDVHLDLYEAPPGWREDALRQGLFMRAQDAPTRRAPFLYESGHSPDISSYQRHHAIVLPFITTPNPEEADSASFSESSSVSSASQVSLSEISTSSEHGISLLDRDEQLAQTRGKLLGNSGPGDPGRPTNPFIDDDMSSGDESDSGDDTSLGSVSDPEESVVQDDGNQTYATAYRRILRRYRTAVLTEPFQHSPFIPENQGSKPLQWFFADDIDTKGATNHSKYDPAIVATDARDNLHITLIRLQSQRQCEFLLTPLISDVINHIVRSQSDIAITMDQRLDQILTAYMDSGPSSKIPKPRMFVIDARLHLWRLSSWQIVRDSGSIEEGPGATSRLSSPTVLCLAAVQIARGSCVGHALSNGLVQLHAAFRRMDVLLRTVLPHQPTFIPSGHITIDSSSINIHLKPLGISVSLVLGDVECTITDASPIVVLGISSAYMLCASAISMEMKAHEERSVLARRLFILKLLQYSKAAVADPFSRTQVSFMVNSGRPKALRSDSSMVIIAMLQGCIRHLGPHDQQEISSSMDSPTSTNFYSEVVRLLKERFDHDIVDIDLENVMNLSLLRLLFPDDTATPSSTDQYSQSSPFLVSLQTHNLKFSLGDPLVPRTELQVGSVRIHVREGLRLLLGPNTSRTSTPVGTIDQRSQTVHVIASCSITQARWNIFPSSLSFLRTLLRLTSDRPATNTDLHMVPSRSRSLVVEILLEVDEAEALASAQLLNFGMRATGLRISTTGIVFSELDPGSSMIGSPFRLSVQAGSRELTLQANATEDLSLLGPERAKLASLSAMGGEAYMILDSSKLRGTVSLGGLKLSVPRSAIKLYRFITEWTAEYLPAYNAMFKGLLSGMDQAVPAPVELQSQASPPLDIDLQASVRVVNVSLHIMHGTWLSWTLYRIMFFGKTPDVQTISCGVEIPAQIIVLSAKPDGSGSVTTEADSSVKLELPSLRVSGVLQHSTVQATITIDKFKLMLKPQYMDDILVVQQKFGQDFNDIVDIFTQTRRKTPSKVPSIPFVYHISGKLDGFSIGIQGPTCVQYLDSPLIRGRIRSTNPSRLQWQLEVNNLALSLVHDASVAKTGSTEGEQYRSAYMAMDCLVHNESPQEAVGLQEMRHLTVSVDKIHALMMPAAVGELGNLVDYVQAEMLQRKEQRVLELQEMKKKTQHVIRSMESSNPPRTQQSPFGNRVISISLRHIGIVFPLSSKTIITALAPSTFTSLEGEKAPAFLVTVQSLDFVTQRDETGNAQMFGLAFQFVPRFDQNLPRHFQSDVHDKLNRMRYPKMSAEVHSRASATSRRIWIRADVTGFELDLAPSFPSYVFSLIDVYREGKEHFERFVPLARDEPGDDQSGQTSPLITPAYSTLPTSDVRLSLEFKSGEVRFHDPNELHEVPNKLPSIVSDTGLRDFSQGLPVESDMFRLPTVTAWLEYHATPASRKLASTTNESAPSRLIFNTVIHSSKNTISPSLLPFLAEITRHVENRLAQELPIRNTPPIRTPVGTVPSSASLSSPSMIRAMEMTCSLRIDQSELEFTSLPDVNVSAGLHWKSGGFLLRIAPGSQETSLVCSVEGIAASLRHGYLVDDCVNASARDLTMAITFSGPGKDIDHQINTLSVVANTQIEASVRFGRLQDILCFKAVWLDRIPLFEGLSKPTPSSVHDAPPLLSVPGPGKKSFATSVLVKIESLKVEVDLGQAITKLILELEPIVLRSRLTDTFSEVSFSCEHVDLHAVRAISGRLTIPSLTFETIRRRHDVQNSTHSTVLELTIQSEELNVEAHYEGKRILLLRADPMEATVHDDWTRTRTDATPSDRQVKLHFTVEGGTIRAGARIMTVSELILVGGKVSTLIRSQKEGAARESQAYQATLTSKRPKTLSNMATAMLGSSRSKIRETDRADFLIIQHMHLKVMRIRLAIFNQADTRMTQFEAVEVQADLLRNVRSQEQVPFRDLNLALQSFEVRGGDMPAADKWLDYYPGAKVFTMPEMNISMQSTEHTESKRLEYDFRSTFPRPKTKAGLQTLYLALDFHKYEQLIAMQNAFKDAVEKALSEIRRLDKRQGSIPPVKSEPTPETGQPAVEGMGYPTTGDETASSAATNTSMTPNTSAVEVGIRGLTYHSNSQNIETPKLHQLGAASPDLETFKQWTNISIRDSLPVWIHEYATTPVEQVMKALLEVYIQQLKEVQRDSA